MNRGWGSCGGWWINKKRVPCREVSQKPRPLAMPWSWRGFVPRPVPPLFPHSDDYAGRVLRRSGDAFDLHCVIAGRSPA